MTKKLARQDGAHGDTPVRVAIVGGGCAGLAAAWHLSGQEGYEIKIFEQSARLGGKGASVRDPEGRILDHGLHIWLGFYENAFRMMRECYNEIKDHGWGPNAAAPDRLVHGGFDEAFFPEPNIGLMQRTISGDWATWSALFPPEPGLPGEPLDENSNPFTLVNYLLRCISLLKTLMVSVIASPDDYAPTSPRPDSRSMTDEVLNHDFSAGTATTVVLERVVAQLRAGTLTGAAVVVQGVRALEAWLADLDVAPQVADSAAQIAQAIAAQIRKIFADLSAIDPIIRIKTEIIDIVITIFVGLFRDRVLFSQDGLDSINQVDYREWLSEHGASPEALNSAFLKGIYDLVFAYKDGDPERPSLAAGVAIRGALRMFLGYRGAMFWRMRSGMGDAVFAPLYKVLSSGRNISGTGDHTKRTRPVQFYFGHRLNKIVVEERNGQRHVTTLEFKRLDGGVPSGTPLDETGCWPASEIQPSEFDTAPTAFVKDDFDAVIFALGVDDLRAAWLRSEHAQPLPDHWTMMFDEVATVATQSVQIWLDKSLRELGWYRGAGLFTALGLQFDTWADMTHTLATEQSWRASARPGYKGKLETARSVAYFCAPMPEAEFKGASSRQDVEHKIAERYDALLARGAQRIWPAAFKNDGNARQYAICRHIKANFQGSDRYTLSLPGSLSCRISPLDRTFENATIAGDWTACGLDVSCIEAAVMSGMLAAHAISGQPELAHIIGYDHP